MAPREALATLSRGQSGQVLVLLLGLVAAAMLGTLVLTAFGKALGGKSRLGRATDLAAVSAAGSMLRDHARLFEVAMLEDGSVNPRHLSLAAYEARARAAAVAAARRNGVHLPPSGVSFPGDSFAPTRVTVRVMGATEVRVDGRRRRAVTVSAKATAELTPTTGGAGQPGFASGGGYGGPLAYRQGKPTPHLFSAL